MQKLWTVFRSFAGTFRSFLGMVGPVLGERQEKLQVRPHFHVDVEPPEELDWPLHFEGHTLEREQTGLRCSVC
eukprot:4666248-Amphidinium_carterae.1